MNNKLKKHLLNTIKDGDFPSEYEILVREAIKLNNINHIIKEKTLLSWNIDYGDAITVQELLKNGASINLCSFKTIFNVIYYADIEKLKTLLNYGLNPNIKNEEGNTLLIKSCENGNHSLAEILLDHNADPYIRNNDDLDVFDISRLYEDTQMLNLLENHAATKAKKLSLKLKGEIK